MELLGDVFGPPPGPADVYGTPTTDEGLSPREDPALVGFVIQVSQYAFVAQRTQTWGGTTAITSKFDDARKFIEAACSQSLRQVQNELTSGPLMFRFYNPVHEIPVGGEVPIPV